MVFQFLSSNNISTDEQILNRFLVEEEATEITICSVRINITYINIHIYIYKYQDYMVLQRD